MGTLRQSVTQCIINGAVHGNRGAFATVAKDTMEQEGSRCGRGCDTKGEAVTGNLDGIEASWHPPSLEVADWNEDVHAVHVETTFLTSS